MIRYTFKRILMIVPIVISVVFVIFIMIYFLPGSNIKQMPLYGGGDALDSFFVLLKADSNLFTQYLRYCYNVFIHFDFGLSRAFEIGTRFSLTLMLTVLGIITALIVGISAGLFAATHHNKWQDHVIMFLTLLFSSIPSYCIAIILSLIFVLNLKLLPLLGYASPAHFVLPTITLSAGGIAVVTRITRVSVLEILSKAYITTLRSRGLSERIVIYLHALKNALIPIVSILGNLTAQLLCSAFVVEYFFNILGIGSYLLEAIDYRHHLAILSASVIIAFVLSGINLATDLLYVLLNPRIKLQYTKKYAKKSNNNIKQTVR